MHWVVFTDLDGTLLDFRDYSFKVANPVVQQLQQKGIPIVFCSSKTRVEQEYYREELQNTSPFIVENGSAILVPKNYFSFDIAELQLPNRVQEKEQYWQIVLGESHVTIRKVIQQVKEELGIALWGYADLSIEEIKEITHLSNVFAQRAATRDFSETLLKGDKESEAFDQFQEKLKEQGLLCVSGGKFHTVMGKNSDKGKAVKILTQLYNREYGEVQTIGLGDSANDLPLLASVDIPYLVQKPDGNWQSIDNERVIRVEGIGPEGWVQALNSLSAI